MVPLAAELVVGDDHQGVGAFRALEDRVQQVDEVAAADGFAGVTGVLVLRPDRLDEADRQQLAGLGLLDELGLVAQVLGAGGRARRVGGIVVERLVVELEVLVRAVRIGRRGQHVGIGAAGRWV